MCRYAGVPKLNSDCKSDFSILARTNGLVYAIMPLVDILKLYARKQECKLLKAIVRFWGNSTLHHGLKVWECISETGVLSMWEITSILLANMGSGDIAAGDNSQLHCLLEAICLCVLSVCLVLVHLFCVIYLYNGFKQFSVPPCPRFFYRGQLIWSLSCLLCKLSQSSRDCIYCEYFSMENLHLFYFA